jgi:beta-glucosidase
MVSEAVLVATAPVPHPVSLYESTGHLITVRIQNSGDVDGAEVAQLYLSFPTVQGVDFPPWQLRGFKKVFLKAGEIKKVRFNLRIKDVSFWNVTAQQWTVAKGDFNVRVATSSRAEGLQHQLTIK